MIEMDHTPAKNIDQMKDSMRAPWIAGDFGAIAREIGAPEAEGFVARLGLEPGARVLDIACGAGNATISLARRGAMVRLAAPTYSHSRRSSRCGSKTLTLLLSPLWAGNPNTSLLSAKVVISSPNPE